MVTGYEGKNGTLKEHGVGILELKDGVKTHGMIVLVINRAPHLTSDRPKSGYMIAAERSRHTQNQPSRRPRYCAQTQDHKRLTSVQTKEVK